MSLLISEALDLTRAIRNGELDEFDVASMIEHGEAWLAESDSFVCQMIRQERAEQVSS